jgi:7-keto-8-aminopelargonate synthetase-like enzyme
MARDLLERGILAPPIRWPAVPHGQARMRFALTPEYTKAQIATLLTTLTEVGKRHGLIS